LLEGAQLSDEDRWILDRLKVDAQNIGRQ